MGAGILPTAVHKGELYFLIGKENKHADTPGYADFGGGSDGNEPLMETAVREFTEETTGFWGSIEEMSTYISAVGSLYIDLLSATQKGKVDYRTYIVPITYSPSFEKFYNSNHAFLESKLPKEVYKNLKIFEKSEVRWVTLDELIESIRIRSRNKVNESKIAFRPYYIPIVKQVIDHHARIYKFVSSRTSYSGRNLYPTLI